MRPGFYIPSLVVLFMVAFDLQNLAAYFRRGVRLDPGQRSNDYTIAVPIYGSPEYLSNLSFLTRYKANTLLLVNATTETMVEFVQILRRDGWRVHPTYISQDDTPNPPRMIREAIREGMITTKYTVRLDGDSIVEDDLGVAIAAIEREGKDLCSARVLPSRRNTLAEKMQGVEYDIAMRNRHLRPWSTSGACHIGKTDAMRVILDNHTCGFFAEDVEMGLVAKHFRMSTGYVDLTVYTDVPPNFKSLAKQRRQWWAGTFRTTVVNADKMMHYPFRQFYYFGLVYLLLATRFISLGSRWEYLPLIPLLYICITTLVNWPVRSRWFVVFPVYMMIQSLFFPVIGTYWFFRKRVEMGLPTRLKIGHRRKRWTTVEQEA
jgi:hypothetical protein